MNTLSPDRSDVTALSHAYEYIHQQLCDSSVQNICKDLFMRDFTKHVVDLTNFQWEYRAAFKRHRALECSPMRLEYACIDGYEVVVRKILSDPLAYSRQDANKSLETACLDGHLDIVKMLIQVGVNPNFYYGSSLRLAIQKGHSEIAQYLIDNGALTNNNVTVHGIN